MILKQLIFTFLLLSSFSLIAQEGTTLEEYRYLSKGYVYQLEMGLDAQKEGYQIKPLFHTSNDADLVGLYKIGDSEPRALLVIIDKGEKKASYFCMPNAFSDQRVKDLANSDQINISTDLKNSYQSALNEFLFAALSNPSQKSFTHNVPMNSPASYQKDETLVSRSANLNQFIDDDEVHESSTQIKIGESILYGEIEDRAILQSEDAVSHTGSKGVVSIKICVDMDGSVSSAKFTQRGSTTFNSYLKKVALDAAKSIKFAKIEQNEQCGIVSYKF